MIALGLFGLVIACLLFFYFRRRQMKAKKFLQLRVGDIVTLHTKYRKSYPELPINNPFTIVGFEESNVLIKYIHFKKITLHHETVAREAIKKIS